KNIVETRAQWGLTPCQSLSYAERSKDLIARKLTISEVSKCLSSKIKKRPDQLKSARALLKSAKPRGLEKLLWLQTFKESVAFQKSYCPVVWSVLEESTKRVESLASPHQFLREGIQKCDTDKTPVLSIWKQIASHWRNTTPEESHATTAAVYTLSAILNKGLEEGKKTKLWKTQAAPVLSVLTTSQELKDPTKLRILSHLSEQRGLADAEVDALASLSIGKNKYGDIASAAKLAPLQQDSPLSAVRIHLEAIKSSALSQRQLAIKTERILSIIEKQKTRKTRNTYQEEMLKVLLAKRNWILIFNHWETFSPQLAKNVELYQFSLATWLGETDFEFFPKTQPFASLQISRTCFEQDLCKKQSYIKRSASLPNEVRSDLNLIIRLSNWRHSLVKVEAPTPNQSINLTLEYAELSEKQLSYQTKDMKSLWQKQIQAGKLQLLSKLAKAEQKTQDQASKLQIQTILAKLKGSNP
ncbi:MAG: hypothetical protein AAF202_09910, partial [Pseudomonadota bacterium]